METIATALSDETAAVAMVQLDANGHRFQHQMDTAEGTAPESSVIQPVQPIEKRPMQVNPSSEPKLPLDSALSKVLTVPMSRDLLSAGSLRTCKSKIQVQRATHQSSAQKSKFDGATQATAAQ